MLTRPQEAPVATREGLRAICPVPSQLTLAQSSQVADALAATPLEHRRGIEILATEWDRLDKASRLCRSEN